jgi:hypothetical protein
VDGVVIEADLKVGALAQRLVQAAEEASAERAALLREAAVALLALSTTPRNGQLRTDGRGSAVRLWSVAEGVFRLSAVVNCQASSQGVSADEVVALYPYVVRT